MDINQDCQYLKQTTSLVYSHQFYMLHLDHTSMTLQYLVMNIFQTPGSCWIQWWNRVINSSRWKTWSLAPMKFFPTPFPFPPLNVSIKRTLSPCILCYQNDMLGTQHLLATKKKWKKHNFDNISIIMMLKSRKLGHTSCMPKLKLKKKWVVNFGVFPGFCLSKFKKDLRNKNSICFWNTC